MSRIMNIVSRHFFNWESFDEDKIEAHLHEELLSCNYDMINDNFVDDFNETIDDPHIAFRLQRWIESNSEKL